MVNGMYELLLRIPGGRTLPLSSAYLPRHLKQSQSQILVTNPVEMGPDNQWHPGASGVVVSLPSQLSYLVCVNLWLPYKSCEVITCKVITITPLFEVYRALADLNRIFHSLKSNAYWMQRDLILDRPIIALQIYFKEISIVLISSLYSFTLEINILESRQLQIERFLYWK